MFAYHKHWVLMTPEYKRWLKRPTKEKLCRLAEQHGYIIKSWFEPGFDKDTFVLIYKDGKSLKKYKGRFSTDKGKQTIFGIEEAMRLINKDVKQTSQKGI